MSDAGLELIVAAYTSQAAADRALNDLKIVQESGQLKVRAATVLDRDTNNELHIRDTGDWGFGKGAMAGGAVGVALGLLAGPVGWAMAGSALVGGIAAK